MLFIWSPGVEQSHGFSRQSGLSSLHASLLLSDFPHLASARFTLGLLFFSDFGWAAIELSHKQPIQDVGGSDRRVSLFLMLFITKKWEYFIHLRTGLVFPPFDISGFPGHLGVSAIQHTFYLWSDCQALTAIEKYRFNGCYKESNFDFFPHVQIPHSVHLV